MNYLDTSALMKLVRRETETDPLRDWLAATPDTPCVTSELGRIELLRAARRVGHRALVEARAVINDVDLIPLSRPIQDLASELGEPALRTLDALHLASAVTLRADISAFVAYDQRLLDAARAAGLVTATPGAEDRHT